MRIPRVLLGLAAMTLVAPRSAPGQSPGTPVAKQIDHVMILTRERERLVALLTDTLLLPLVWPQPGDSWVSTTGIALGDVNLEFVPSDRVTTTRLGNLAIQPVELATASDNLRQRGLVPREPSTQVTDSGTPRWTIIGFRHAFRGIAFFLIQYRSFDMNERRARFDQTLRQRRGGPLGFRKVREFRLAYAHESLPGARQAWRRLLGGASAADSNYFELEAGPAIRLVPEGGSPSGGLLIEVESLARAADAARSMLLLLRSLPDSVVLDPIRFGGLRLTLIER